jgi:hypothetical protein
MKKFMAILALIAMVMFTTTAYAQSSLTGAANATTNSAAEGGMVVIGGSTGVSNTPGSYAPGLVAGLATCSGSSSVGGSGKIISLSFGSTWKDEDCQAGNFGQQLWSEGMHSAAIGVLCSRDVIRYAIATTGGIPYLRKDGVVVYRACPMRPKEWTAAGEPLLDPISGTPYTDAELNPPIKVVAPIAAVELTPAQEAAVIAKMTPEQRQALAKEAKIESIETHASTLGAPQTVATK